MKSRTVYGLMISERSENMQEKVRSHLVRYAQKYGIKAATRHFGCSRNTIRLWKRRYEAKGSSGLVNRSKAPINIPHKTPASVERQIIRYREKAPCYGPKRLKWFFPIKASEGAVARILRQKKLTRKRRKKYQRKQDLREKKAAYKALTYYQLDVKYLTDIPYYWPQMMRKKLPKYQYTLRDVKSGMIALGYAQEYSELHSILFTEKYLNHLKTNGLKLDEVTIQTDNGSEFGGRKRNINSEGLTNTIEEKYGAHHNFIPPGMCNANADVESIHATIESEFFDLETFKDQEEFFVKAQAYQYFYNLVRPNFSKKAKVPQEIIKEDLPEIGKKMLDYPVVNIDSLFRESYYSEFKAKGGQYLPILPVFEICKSNVIMSLFRQCYYSVPRYIQIF